MSWKSTNEPKALKSLEKEWSRLEKKGKEYKGLRQICKEAPLPAVRLAAYELMIEFRRIHPVYVEWDVEMDKIVEDVMEGITDPQILSDLIQKIGPDRIKLYFSYYTPLVKHALFQFRKSDLDYLIPLLKYFDPDHLCDIAEYYKDLRLTIEVIRVRWRNDYSERLFKVLLQCARGITREKALEIIEDNKDYPTVPVAMMYHIGDDRQAASLVKDIDIGTKDMIIITEHAYKLVNEPQVKTDLQHKLNDLKQKDKKETIENKLQSGLIGVDDINLFTGPKDIHEAFQIVCKTCKRKLCYSEVYFAFMKKLNDLKNIPQLKTDIVNELKNFCIPLGWSGFSDYEALKKTVQWKILLELDQESLKEIAKEAKAKEIRWKACVLAGGHQFPETRNRCRCDICGFQHHIFPQGLTSGNPYQCKACGGMIKAQPFCEGMPHSEVTYFGNGTDIMDGYDGLLHGEERFVKENGLDNQ